VCSVVLCEKSVGALELEESKRGVWEDGTLLGVQAMCTKVIACDLNIGGIWRRKTGMIEYLRVKLAGEQSRLDC